MRKVEAKPTLDALRKVEYDLYYIKNESLYLDLLILLRTVAASGAVTTTTVPFGAATRVTSPRRPSTT